MIVLTFYLNLNCDFNEYLDNIITIIAISVRFINIKCIVLSA